MKPAIIIAAIAVGLFRPVLLFVEFNPHIQAGYEAFAHILVGGLLGAWLMNRRMEPLLDQRIHTDLSRRWMMQSLVILTAIEVICAGITIARKFV